jgi:hypothetical protein
MLLDVLGGNLNSKTLCPSSRHYLSEHYNLHSMFGYFESKASNMSVPFSYSIFGYEIKCLTL